MGLFTVPRHAWRRVRDFIVALYHLPAQTERLDRRLALLAEQMDEHRRETRVLLSGLSLPPGEVWRDRPVMVEGAPGHDVFPHSTVCRQASFETPCFAYWTDRLNQGLRYHRKLWEFVFIAQALWERGAVRPDARGLGFGVGVEPLSAYFASQDCRVTATDMDMDQAVAMGWTITNQHAQGKAALRYPRVCPDDLFESNVTFRPVDMNAVPDDLVDYDFCWSACALEHLGSIEQGLAFIERSLDCLKPGGLAIHTTEFNLSSNEDTVDHAETVLFRRRDIDDLVERLTARGHTVAPLDLEPGDGPVDRFIDVPPYRPVPHLQMVLGGFATTSLGLIIRKGEA